MQKSINQHHHEQYHLVAQNRDEEVVIAAYSLEEQFVTSATEIVNNPDLIKRFSSQDAAIIGFIAGMSTSQRK